MNPRHRHALVAVLASLLAVQAGWGIAQEHYAWVALLALLVVLFALDWLNWLRPEAATVALLVAGYVLGNRGFAQLMPLGQLPLPIGEVGLALCTGLVIVRSALRRTLPLQADALNRCLLLWMAFGAARLPWDFRLHGFYALRDFAAVYYAAFFFCAQSFLREPRAGPRLHALLVWVFALLPPLALLVEAFPSFFLNTLTFRGVPLFYYKGDLLATFLCSGFFLLVPMAGTPLPPPVIWLRRVTAVVSLGLGLYLLSRAALVGVAVGLTGCALAGRWQVLRIAGFTVVLGLLLAVGETAVAREDFKQSRLYAAYEHVVSMIDISGTRRYENVESADSGANNQFRTIWWRAIFRQTIAEGPIFGLGFGYDLAEGFIRDFDPAIGEEFSTRSPHSFIMTVFGRMGGLGLAVWLLFTACMARASWRLARQARGREGPEIERALMYHTMCWVIMVSACFGVVLEGPMGAVPFWTLLGLAHRPDVTAPAEAANAGDS